MLYKHTVKKRQETEKKDPMTQLHASYKNIHLLYNNKWLKVKLEQRPNMQALINRVEIG